MRRFVASLVLAASFSALIQAVRLTEAVPPHKIAHKIAHKIVPEIRRGHRPTIGFAPSIEVGKPIVPERSSSATNRVKNGQEKYHFPDPGGYVPGPGSAMFTLRPSVQAAFACIRHYESRGHVVDGPNSSGSEGLYGFLVGTGDGQVWALYVSEHPGFPATPNQASAHQQDAVAAWDWFRNGELWTQWASDPSCVAMVR